MTSKDAIISEQLLSIKQYEENNNTNNHMDINNIIESLTDFVNTLDIEDDNIDEQLATLAHHHSHPDYLIQRSELYSHHYLLFCSAS